MKTIYKGEIIQKQASVNNYRVIMVCSVFSFVLFSSPQSSFFSSKPRKESSEKMFPFKV